jgi:RNA polymerase sigma-70 factor (ECF subfamily)
MRSLTRPDARIWSDPPPHGQDEIHQLVRLALRKLPPTQAEVVVLKIWEEMTFAEVGEILGQSPNTAASRYRYALQKLAQHLHAVAEEVRHV